MSRSSTLCARRAARYSATLIYAHALMRCRLRFSACARHYAIERACHMRSRHNVIIYAVTPTYYALRLMPRRHFAPPSGRPPRHAAPRRAACCLPITAAADAACRYALDCYARRYTVIMAL